MLAQFLAGHAGGPTRADQCADGGAGNDRWPEAKFIHGLDIGDMGEPTRRAAAQGNADLGAGHSAHSASLPFLGAQPVHQYLAPFLQRGQRAFRRRLVKDGSEEV
ncbi:hypothetical protein D3C87_1690850 [compost metagenome]